MRENINILCAADDNYAPHLGVMICSLLKNCSCRRDVQFYIINGGINKKNVVSIKSLVHKFSAKIIFIQKDFPITNLPFCGHIGIATYYRIFFPDILKDLKKAIYLDCDLIILGDIKILWDYSFNNIVCAAKDMAAIEHYSKSSLRNVLKDYDLTYYFNAGVMIINLEKWREEKITPKTLYFLQNYHYIFMGDQDGLNYTLKNQWSELDFRWNVCSYDYYEPFAYIKRNIARKKYRYILQHPYIIHFGTHLKPWMANDIHPLKKEYFYYLNFTPWKKKFPTGKKNYLYKFLFYLRANIPMIIRIIIEEKLLIAKKITTFLNLVRF